MRPDLAGATVLGVLLASMPVFAIRSRGRPLPPDIDGRPPSVMMGSWLRDWMVWVIGPLEGALVRARVSPTVLNGVGAAAGIAAGAAFAAGALGLAAWMIGLGGICDILDGRVARARGIASRYGAFLDSTLDRFAETATFVGVAWYSAGSPALAAVTVLAIGGSLLVSYTRARGESLGVGSVGGLMQRPERVVLLTLGSLFDATAARWLGWAPGTLLAITVAAIAVGTVATAIYRTVVILRRLARGDREPAAGPDGTR